MRSADSLKLSAKNFGNSRTGWNVTTISGAELGTAQLISEAYVYGVYLADTVDIVITTPISVGVIVWEVQNAQGQFVRSLDADTVRVIGPGGEVSWENGTNRTIDVVFDDSTLVLDAIGASGRNSGGGNILAIPVGDPALGINHNVRWRRFPAAGRYRYRIEPDGLVGAIVVKDQ
jgi:hypothetical protein